MLSFMPHISLNIYFHKEFISIICIDVFKPCGTEMLMDIFLISEVMLSSLSKVAHLDLIVSQYHPTITHTIYFPHQDLSVCYVIS
jgi:hypothetical protein